MCSGVSRLARLVERLPMFRLEVLPQVLHVSDLRDLGDLQGPALARPVLHCLTKRLKGLSNLLHLVVESLGCSVVEKFLCRLSSPEVRLRAGLDVSSVELRLGLILLLPAPGEGLAGLDGGEGGGRERVRSRLHGAAVELGLTPRPDEQRLPIDSKIRDSAIEGPTHLFDSSGAKLMTKGSDSETCRPSLSRVELRPREAVRQSRRLSPLNMISSLSSLDIYCPAPGYLFRPGASCFYSAGLVSTVGLSNNKLN